MTETDAKTKWCPMGFDARSPHLFADPDGKCKASACMMWRYGEPEATYPEGAKVVHIPYGYCGLAGKA